MTPRWIALAKSVSKVLPEAFERCPSPGLVGLFLYQGRISRLSDSKQTTRSRKLLVAVEVACSVTLLIVTGLITRSFSHLLSQERQFNSQQVVISKADLSNPKYSSGEEMPDNPGADRGSLARDSMIDRTLDQLRALPGVHSAAMTSVMPLTGDMNVDGLVRPDHPVPQGRVPMANRRFTSPGYFSTMEIPLLAGRDFSEKDRENPRVVILSDKAAKAAFAEENPLGRNLRHWGRNYTVVGIASDARTNDLKRDAPIFYLPYWDFPPESPVFMVRSSQTIRPWARRCASSFGVLIQTSRFRPWFRRMRK